MTKMISEHFTEEEVSCNHCGEKLIVNSFLERLEALRASVGRPLKINSWFRCKKYNNAVSETGSDGPHTTGMAADIYVANTKEAFEIVSAAVVLGFTGIGVRCKSGGSGFVHVDTLPVTKYPRPRFWTY